MLTRLLLVFSVTHFEVCYLVSILGVNTGHDHRTLMTDWNRLYPLTLPRSAENKTRKRQNVEISAHHKRLNIISEYSVSFRNVVHKECSSRTLPIKLCHLL
jgi:hypothetical protein